MAFLEKERGRNAFLKYEERFIPSLIGKSTHMNFQTPSKYFNNVLLLDLCESATPQLITTCDYMLTVCLHMIKNSHLSSNMTPFGIAILSSILRLSVLKSQQESQLLSTLLSPMC